MIPNDIGVFLTAMFDIYRFPFCFLVGVSLIFIFLYLYIFSASLIFIPLAQLLLKRFVQFPRKRNGLVGYYLDFYEFVFVNIFDLEYFEKFAYKDFDDKVLTKNLYITGGYLAKTQKYKMKNQQKINEYIKNMKNQGYEFAGVKDTIVSKPLLLIPTLYIGMLTWGIKTIDPVILAFIKNENEISN